MESFLVLAVLTSAARAQEVEWRHDYTFARREALDKNRPLIIDFTTENCFWCNKLETTTFRDSAVLSLLNDKFIPLKVSAQLNPQLTEALRIQSFPTLVLAAPDGKILSTLEGYLEAPKLAGHLQRTLTAVTNPDWMVRDVEEANKAITAGDQARAMGLLKSVLEDNQERPIQVQARHLLKDLEKQAADRLAQARQLEDKGQNAQALQALTKLLKTFPGTQAATEGGQLLTTLALKPEVKQEQRTRRAQELLTQARADYQNQQFLCCMDHCEVLAANYGDLPEGAEAAKLVEEIKSNPEWMRKACESLSERLALLYLCLAENLLKKGQPHEAALYLERVIQAFPSTPQAEVAQVRLSQIQGQPTQQTDFKKAAEKEEGPAVP
ncbi:MAG: thioredoxin family protein [Planctomycetes bacterium]|nr:thioredoxin family protein [Planctomycetota bacterium]